MVILTQEISRMTKKSVQVSEFAKKGEFKMGKRLIYASKVVAKAAKAIVSANINSTCIFVAHQPKLPKGAEKLRKL